MTGILPYDIWCIIARFVPDDELVKLYVVNSAFFHRAMKITYREVQISHLEDEGTLRCVRNFGPAIADYVQTLILRPHALGYYMYGASDFRGFLAETLWRVQGRVDARAVPSGPAAARILLRGIEKMQNITSLKIVHFCPDTYPYFVLALPLVTGVLASSGSRIRELCLDVPLESYEHILPPNLRLKSLETISILIHSQQDLPAKPNYVDPISVSLVPFILRHRHTLKHIAIDISYRHGSVDLSSIFPGLDDCFPRLVSVTISIPFEYVYKPGIQTLLANHSAIIQELKLVFYPPFLREDFLLPPDQFFALPIFQIPLPRLRLLDLDLWMWPQTERQSATRNLVNYLYPIQDILSVLILRHHLFCVNDVHTILDPARGSFPSLSRLQICVRYLCVDLFDLLASRLPHLLRLDISFDTLGGCVSDTSNAQNSYPTNVQTFHSTMQQRRYTNWELRHLELSLMGNAAGRWEECCDVIAKALPNVLSFNGVSKNQASRGKATQF